MAGNFVKNSCSCLLHAPARRCTLICFLVREIEKGTQSSFTLNKRTDVTRNFLMLYSSSSSGSLSFALFDSDDSDDAGLNQLTPASAIAIKVPGQNEHHNPPCVIPRCRRSTIRLADFGIGPNAEAMMPREQNSDDDMDDAEDIVRVLEICEPPENVMSEAEWAEEQDMSENPLPAYSTWRRLTHRHEILPHIQYFIRMGVRLDVLRRICRVDRVTMDGEDGWQVRFF